MWNQIKTVILLAGLSALLLSLGYLVGGKGGLHVAFIMALIMNGISYFLMKRMIIKIF